VKALLDYMYHGEVSIEEEELQGKNFIKPFFYFVQKFGNYLLQKFSFFFFRLAESGRGTESQR
jgi:hypothetical protein